MKINLVITSILGLLAVVLGAFGAHALKEMLSPEQLNSFETAVRYQFYHVFVLLILNLYSGFSVAQKKWLSTFFFTGILLFSGCIYTIQLTSITAKQIWFVTPLGGVFLIAGWFFMIIIFLKNFKKD
jgi:uncharacterized membrane protein YgdD (TMEM256/DUF423 family)